MSLMEICTWNIQVVTSHGNCFMVWFLSLWVL